MMEELAAGQKRGGAEGAACAPVSPTVPSLHRFFVLSVNHIRTCPSRPFYARQPRFLSPLAPPPLRRLSAVSPYSHAARLSEAPEWQLWRLKRRVGLPRPVWRWQRLAESEGRRTLERETRDKRRTGRGARRGAMRRCLFSRTGGVARASVHSPSRCLTAAA